MKITAKLRNFLRKGNGKKPSENVVDENSLQCVPSSPVAINIFKNLSIPDKWAELSKPAISRLPFEPTVEQLTEALLASYTADTSEWTGIVKMTDNVLVGHCHPTVLIINDYKGGEIVYCHVKGRRADYTGSCPNIFASLNGSDHLFNITRDGEVVDVTKGQFEEGVEYEIKNSNLKRESVGKYGYLTLRNGVANYLLTKYLEQSSEQTLAYSGGKDHA